MRKRRLALGALVAGDAAVLVLCRPQFGRLAQHLAAADAWFRQDGADAAVATLAAAALWVVAAWIGLGLIAGIAAQLPGIGGRAGATVSDVLLPSALRRLVAGSVGLSIAVSPIAATAATGTPGLPTAVAATSTQGSVHVPAPAWPVTTQSAQLIRVRPGDSLWLLAARHLGAHAAPGRVAAEWPRWWAVNRAVIGDDPSLIQPGQVLTVPRPGGDGR